MSPAGPVHDDLITFLAGWSTSVIDTDTIQVRIQCGLELTEQESRPEPDWIVDTNAESIQLFRDPQRTSGQARFQFQQRFELGMHIAPACLPQAILSVSSLFGREPS
jgi:hypothetical protein